jgi:type VII secretion protein EccE
MMAVRRFAGRFGALQLVAVEVAVLAGGLAYALSGAWRVVAATAAVVLVAGAVGRVGGRWGYEAIAARLRLWRRRGRVPAGAGGSSLAALVPGLRTVNVTDRGTAIGIGLDTAGWFAAVSVHPDDAALVGGASLLSLDWLAPLVSDAALPVTTLQVVAHDVAEAAVHAADPSAQSYRELCTAFSIPMYRNIWICARLAPRDGALLAAERGGGLLGIHRALSTVLARVGAALADRGLRHVVLDADGLRQALMVGFGPEAGVRQPGGAARPDRAGLREAWSAWLGPAATHVCFAVRRWPAAPPPNLLTAIGQIPDALAMSVAVTVRGRSGSVARPVPAPRRVPASRVPAPRGSAGRGSASRVPAPRVPAPRVPAPRGSAPRGGVVTHTLIRVVAPPTAADECARRLHAAAARLGIQLRRLNGEHAAGVCATVPNAATIGGGPW